MAGVSVSRCSDPEAPALGICPTAGPAGGEGRRSPPVGGPTQGDCPHLTTGQGNHRSPTRRAGPTTTEPPGAGRVERGRCWCVGRHEAGTRRPFACAWRLRGAGRAAACGGVGAAGGGRAGLRSSAAFQPLQRSATSKSQRRFKPFLKSPAKREVQRRAWGQPGQQGRPRSRRARTVPERRPRSTRTPGWVSVRSRTRPDDGCGRGVSAEPGGPRRARAVAAGATAGGARGTQRRLTRRAAVRTRRTREEEGRGRPGRVPARHGRTRRGPAASAVRPRRGTHGPGQGSRDRKARACVGAAYVGGRPGRLPAGGPS